MPSSERRALNDWPTQSCAGNELALFNNCYEVRGYGQYHQFNKACGGSVKPHSVESQLEASWLAYFLGDGNPEVWIANGEALDYYEEIKPVKQKMKRKHIKKYGEYKGPAPVKLRMKQLSDGLQRGQAIFAHPNESHSFLCSKSGVYLKQGIEHLVSEAEKLDFDIKQLFDNNGLPRPFIRFNWVQPVQATKYDADITKMHEICRVFVNGYVASRFDFQNDTEYQKIFQANTRAFKVFRVPIKRHKSVTVDPFCPDATAAKRAEFKNTMQKRFSYITIGGNMSTVPVEHWQSEFPKNLCADTPRITVAMTPKGYRDYPAITRLPVLCTFGNPPNLKTRPEDSICPKGAHYDSKKQQCQCNDPNTDGRKVDPESFGHLPEVS
ncbi:unnamed protein product [Nippostrongylus brasiliensis]|uniref:Helitron_like_N domain-containing protein n=1 Tax=Nippostrongylus brasiliensis TaxID=27835 RepID=A0A0N4YG94_NIPBR|nr:unnamed protein product [Nippostrongylus brasiliensis]